MATGAILHVRNSLLIVFLAISDQYAILFFINLYFLWFFLQNGHRRPFWMSEIHFRAQFWPFQINTQLFLCDFFYKMAAGGHFRCPKITFGRISDHFRSIRNFFFNYFTKWLPSAILDRTTMSIIELVRYILMSNGFVKSSQLSRWQRNCDAAADHAAAALLTKT